MLDCAKSQQTYERDHEDDTIDNMSSLLKLLMHEYCEYINHPSPEATFEDVFLWVSSLIQERILMSKESINEKQEKVKIVQNEYQALQRSLKK